MTRILQLLILAAVTQVASAGGDPARNWPMFRGPLATGEAPQAKPPTQWSEDKNIRWKVSLPGRSHATPIIWGDRIYIQTAVKTDKDALVAESYDAGRGDNNAPAQNRRPRGEFGPEPPPKFLFDFQVIALDRQNGKTIWTTTVKEAHPNETSHGYDSLASGTPVTDGENTYAYFGSRGLHCLSLDGKIKWSVDPGQIKSAADFDEGSSTAIYGDTVIINWEHEGKGYLVAIDKHTGKEKWRKARDEHTTWSTPLIVEADGKPQVIVSATKNIESYDLNTGKEVWRCKGMTESVIPSPMAAGNLLYAISGY